MQGRGRENERGGWLGEGVIPESGTYQQQGAVTTQAAEQKTPKKTERWTIGSHLKHKVSSDIIIGPIDNSTTTYITYI